MTLADLYRALNWDAVDVQHLAWLAEHPDKDDIPDESKMNFRCVLIESALYDDVPARRKESIKRLWEYGVWDEIKRITKAEGLWLDDSEDVVV